MAGAGFAAPLPGADGAAGLVTALAAVACAAAAGAAEGVVAAGDGCGAALRWPAFAARFGFAACRWAVVGSVAFKDPAGTSGNRGPPEARAVFGPPIAAGALRAAWPLAASIWRCCWAGQSIDTAAAARASGIAIRFNHCLTRLLRQPADPGRRPCA